MCRFTQHCAVVVMVLGTSFATACRPSSGPIQADSEDDARFVNPTESDIPRLVELLQSGDDDARHNAADALGRIGSQQCIAPMLVALADDDDYLRSNAMRGIERGIESNRCTKEFLEAMLPALEKLLTRDDSTVSGTAPALLLAIDPERAIPILLANHHFTPANGQLQYIIRALYRHGTKIPHEKLLPLLGELKPLIDKYPNDYAYAEALVAYADHPDAKAEQLFRAEIESPNEEVKEAAAEALAILFGVLDPYGVAFRKLEEVGFENLTEPQRDYVAVATYHAEVNNGGHSQYFWNSSGDPWKSAVSGLSAVGARERVKVLQDAVDLFGPSGPSENRVERVEQLHHVKSQSSRLNDLDTLYYNCKENVRSLLSIYAINHKADFTQSDQVP